MDDKIAKQFAAGVILSTLDALEELLKLKETDPYKFQKRCEEIIPTGMTFEEVYNEFESMITVIKEL